jgi:hypothetical protein
MLHNNNLQVKADEVKDLSYETLVRQGRVAAAICGMRLVGICAASVAGKPQVNYVLSGDGKEAAL